MTFINKVDVQYFQDESQLYTWEYHLNELNLKPEALKRLNILNKIQELINEGILSFDQEIQKKLSHLGYNFSRDEKEIESFKKKYLFAENLVLQENVLKANSQNGLLIGIQIDYKKVYPNNKLKTPYSEQLFVKMKKDFHEVSSIVDKYAIQVIDKEWAKIKEERRTDKLDRDDIYYCNRFINMGLVQFECSMEMKQLIKNFQSIPEGSSAQNSAFNEIYKTLDSGIESLQYNRYTWENEVNADLGVIENQIKSMIELNIEIRELSKNMNQFKIFENGKILTNRINADTNVNIGFVGLKNLGNSCYMNASIQLLRIIPDVVSKIKEISLENKPFVENLRNLINSSKINNEEVLKNLQKLFFEMIKINKEDRKRDQDAHEFITFTLSQLGWLPLESHSCIRTNGKEEFVDKQASSHIQINFNVDNDKIAINLQEIINNYSRFENVDEIEKSIELINTPEYIILQLARFEYNKTSGVSKKKCNPLYHCLSNSVKMGSENYQIEGWINHKGENIDFGHYVSILKKDENWINYDDEKVDEVNPELISEDAYIVLIKKILKK